MTNKAPRYHNENEKFEGDGTYLYEMKEKAKNESKSAQWKLGAAANSGSRKLVEGGVLWGEYSYDPVARICPHLYGGYQCRQEVVTLDHSAPFSCVSPETLYGPTIWPYPI